MAVELKRKLITPLFFLFTIFFLSFEADNQIDKCFVNFKKTPGLKTPGPAGNKKFPVSKKTIKEEILFTENGTIKISVLKSSGLVYTNAKNLVFARIRIRLLTSETYGMDTLAYLSHWKLDHSKKKEFYDTENLTELSFNGFKIYGSRANTMNLERGKGFFSGSYVLFPKKDIVVLINFNPLDSVNRHYSSLTEMHSKYNEFIGNYTYHLRKCLGK